MKYELRRLGEAVQYATAIAPYDFCPIRLYFSVFFRGFCGKKTFNPAASPPLTSRLRAVAQCRERAPKRNLVSNPGLNQISTR